MSGELGKRIKVAAPRIYIARIRPSSLSLSMPSDFVISSWLADVDAAAPVEKPSHGRTLRKRARPAAEAEAALRKKQRALAPTAAKHERTTLSSSIKLERPSAKPCEALRSHKSSVQGSHNV